MNILQAVIVFCASYLIWVVVAAAVAFIYFAKDRLGYIAVTLASGALAWGIAKALAALWYDPRPFVVGHFTPLIAHAADNGFPSDHALLSGVLASAVFAYDRRWGAALWLCALLIGMARVAAGVHHALDIAGSFVIAAAAVAAVALAARRLRA
jgi:undecaprenyl-diphosphatase